jgi:hypothetical protein
MISFLVKVRQVVFLKLYPDMFWNYFEMLFAEVYVRKFHLHYVVCSKDWEDMYMLTLVAWDIIDMQYFNLKNITLNRLIKSSLYLGIV